MFEIGDKVIYPMYGAGIVENIEVKERQEKQEKFYVIYIPNGNMKISVVAKNSDALGLRPVGAKEEVSEILQEAAEKEKEQKISENWNQRYKDNLEKIKTGRLLQVAEVVKSLNTREKQKGLSNVEKRLFNTAKQIVLSEIAFSYEIEKEKAEELLANLVLNC